MRLEAALRAALAARGVPQRIYVDNGSARAERGAAMSSMADQHEVVVPGVLEEVVGGVDTHGQTHHCAVLDGLGRELADRQFPATSAGYAALLGWLRGFGRLSRVGVEGTGSFGAGLAVICAPLGSWW